MVALLHRVRAFLALLICCKAGGFLASAQGRDRFVSQCLWAATERPRNTDAETATVSGNPQFPAFMQLRTCLLLCRNCCSEQTTRRVPLQENRYTPIGGDRRSMCRLSRLRIPQSAMTSAAT